MQDESSIYAVVGFAFGLLALFIFPPIFGMLGIVFGIISIKKDPKSNLSLACILFCAVTMLIGVYMGMYVGMGGASSYEAYLSSY